MKDKKKNQDRGNSGGRNNNDDTNNRNTNNDKKRKNDDDNNDPDGTLNIARTTEKRWVDRKIKNNEDNDDDDNNNNNDDIMIRMRKEMDTTVSDSLPIDMIQKQMYSTNNIEQTTLRKELYQMDDMNPNLNKLSDRQQRAILYRQKQQNSNKDNDKKMTSRGRLVQTKLLRHETKRYTAAVNAVQAIQILQGERYENNTIPNNDDDDDEEEDNSSKKSGKKQQKQQLATITTTTNTNIGMLIPENDIEKTTKMNQVQLKRQLIQDGHDKIAQNIYNIQLHDMIGPYGIQYDRSGRYMSVYSQGNNVQSQIAFMDCMDNTISTEFQLSNEKIYDIKYLHNHTMAAIAQKNHVYIYDTNSSAEIHYLDQHITPGALQFLPYHYLLASISRTTSYLSYQDTSTGQFISKHKTKSYHCNVLKQNIYNSILHVGDKTNGTVTLWCPSSSQYIMKILCHKGSGISSMDISNDGRYMITGSNDYKIKIWDLRMLQNDIYTYYTSTKSIPTSIDISQKNMFAVGHSGTVSIWDSNAFIHKAKLPYMEHHISSLGGQRPINQIQFRNYDDYLSIGHSNGYSNIYIPGSSEPIIDTYEYNVNPLAEKKQRREDIVQSLLGKLNPFMITLDPQLIGSIECSNDQYRMKQQHNHLQLMNLKNNYKNNDKKNKEKKNDDHDNEENYGHDDTDRDIEDNPRSDDDKDDDNNNSDDDNGDNNINIKKKKRGGKRRGRSKIQSELRRRSVNRNVYLDRQQTLIEQNHEHEQKNNVDNDVPSSNNKNKKKKKNHDDNVVRIPNTTTTTNTMNTTLTSTTTRQPSALKRFFS